jgi:hypothetical protein
LCERQRRLRVLRLYHRTNAPLEVLPGADPSYDDVELLLTLSSSHPRDYDVLITIDIPDREMDLLTQVSNTSWTATNAQLELAGADVNCASERDCRRVEVYRLAAERDGKLQTIARLRRYIDAASDQSEASWYMMMLPSHLDHLADLELAVATQGRQHDVRHLIAANGVAV